MKIETIDLYNFFNVNKPKNAQGILTKYVLERNEEQPKNRIRPGMLVLPGGGYAYCSKREAEPIAIAYNNQGFNSYVLEYSCTNENVTFRYPTQLIEACMAMAYIREKSNEDFTDETKVCAVGFSAGGHLCGSLATLFNEKCVKEVIGDKNVRPDAVILSYPVITSGEKAHRGSFDCLCGSDLELQKKLSLEDRVNNDSSPAFIWSTSEDTGVPCESSLYMALAYRKNNIPIELHIFEHGRHGLSLGTKDTKPEFEYIQPWFNLSIKWLKERGFEIKD